MTTSAAPDSSVGRRPFVPWPLVAILLLAALLRLAGLSTFSLWYDEGASLYLGNYLETPTALFDRNYTAEPPLNAVVTGLWSGLVDAISPTDVTSPLHDALLRLLPALLGILNCFLVYRLTRQLVGNERSATIAAFLFAIAPFQLYYAQELRIYSLYVTLALLAVAATERALNDGALRYWAGYIVALSLLMYSHYFSMWLIFSLNVTFVTVLHRYRMRFWYWTGANALLMVLIAPALYQAFAMHAEVQGLEIAWYPSPTWKTALITFKTFVAGFSPRAWAYWPLFLLGLGLFVVGCIRRAPWDLGVAFVVCLTGVPLIGCVWLWGQADFSFYEHRLFLFSGAMALIGMAAGVTQLGRWSIPTLVIFSLLTVPCLGDYYGGRLHPAPAHRIAMWDKVDFRGAATLLEETWREGDRLVYTSHFSAYPMYHYFPHDQIRIGWGPEDKAVFIKTLGHEAILRAHQLMPIPKEQAIAGAKRIWLLQTHGITFEWQPTTERIATWLETRGTATESHPLYGLTLTSYEVSGTP